MNLYKSVVVVFDDFTQKYQFKKKVAYAALLDGIINAIKHGAKEVRLFMDCRKKDDYLLICGKDFSKDYIEEQYRRIQIEKKRASLEKQIRMQEESISNCQNKICRLKDELGLLQNNNNREVG